MTMKEQVVRAGKYFSVGVLCLACLPVLPPFLFLLSIFGFTFLLPLGCGLAGFLVLRKFVGMLYWKLSTYIAGGSSLWGQRPPTPKLFLEDLPHRDLQAIESSEAVDPEFDAVVISRAPSEVPRGSIEGANDTDINSGLGGVSLADVSADYATRGEGLDGDTFVKDDAGIGGKGDYTVVNSGTKREGKDDVRSEESGTVRVVKEDDPLTEDGARKGVDEDTSSYEGGTRREGEDDVTSEENGTVRAVKEEPLAEDGARTGVDEDTSSSESVTRREGKDDVTSEENWTVKEVKEDDPFAEDGAREGVDEGASSYESGSRRKGEDDVTSEENGTVRAVKEEPFAEDGARKGVDEDISSSESGTRREGKDDVTSEENWTVKEVKEDDPFAEDGARAGVDEDASSYESESRRKGNDDVTSEENGIVGEVKEDGPSVDDGTRKEGKREDTSNESGTRREGIDEDTSVEDENRGHGREDHTSAEGGTRREGKDSTPLEEWPIRDGNHDSGQIEVGEGETALVEEGELQDVGASKQLSGEEAGVRSEERDDDGHVEGKEAETVVDEDGQLQDVGRSKEFSNEDQGIGSNHFTSLHEDSPHSGNWNVHAGGVENVHEPREERLAAADSLDDSSSRTPIVDEREEKWEETSSEDFLGRAADDDHNNATVVERVSEGGCQTQEEKVEEQGEEVENLNEEKMEKNASVNTSSDDGFHTMPIAVNHEESFPPSARPEVNEEQDGKDNGVDKTLEETKEQQLAAVPDECVHRELSEDWEIKSGSSMGGSMNLDDSNDAFEEGTRKRDGLGNLLPHQADEYDIWICKECGWKYPNAKPSAKIRRNHKKHCKGPAPRSPASDDGMLPETLFQHNDGVVKSRPYLKSSSPLSNSSPEQIREGEVEETSNTESGREGGRFSRVVKADDQMTEHPTRGADLPITHGEQGSSSTNGLQFGGIQDDPGSITDPPSAAISKDERIHSSPSWPQDDGISPSHVHHSRGVTFDDGGGAAVSSTDPGWHYEESGVEFESFRSESFRSAPDEFPDKWASFSGESQYDNEQHKLTQLQQEQRLSDDVNAVKGIIGDKKVSTGALISDIEELSEFLGMDLPERSLDVPEIEWAKLAIELMKVVVGID